MTVSDAIHHLRFTLPPLRFAGEKLTKSSIFRLHTAFIARFWVTFVTQNLAIHKGWVGEIYGVNQVKNGKSRNSNY